MTTPTNPRSLGAQYDPDRDPAPFAALRGGPTPKGIGVE